MVHRRGALLALALTGSASGCAEHNPLAASRLARDTTTAIVIAAENQRTGNADWSQYATTTSETGAAAFLDRRSALPGDSVHVYGVSPDSELDIKLFRMGWYGGTGGRLVLDAGVVPVQPQGQCTAAVPGPVECDWPVATAFQLPPDAVSGVYVVRYTDRRGVGNVLPLVVRAAPPTGIVVVLSFNTYQAYNAWGGSGFYDFDNGVRVPLVSFARPYRPYVIGSHFLSLDVPLVRFLERWHYPVSYAADADLDVDPFLAAGSRLLILSGHGEYWTAAMRLHTEQLLQAGTGLAFFGGNDMYFRVAYEASPSGRLSPVVVCYKLNDDPVSANGGLGTGRFRDPPYADPENALIGVMYAGYSLSRSVPMVVRDTPAEFFHGTGYLVGDSTPVIAGWEGDRIVDNGHTPRGIKVLFEAHFMSDQHIPDAMQTTFYVAKSGAGVFAAGTVGWNWGLNDLGPLPPDERQERFVRNLLDWYLR